MTFIMKVSSKLDKLRIWELLYELCKILTNNGQRKRRF